MTIAVNDAGDAMTLEAGAWKPAIRAVNDKTGESLVLDGGAWKPMPAAPAMSTPYSPDSIPAPQADAGGQSQVHADVNSVAQGLVDRTGSLIAGAGRAATSAEARGTEHLIDAMDLVDGGDVAGAMKPLTPVERGMLAGYIRAKPDGRADLRATMTQNQADLASRPENAATRAGSAVEDFAKNAFPVAPENEGIQTGVGRMIGGVGPALLATAAGTAVGGPVGGVLAGAATIGSQTYDSTYQDAISKGATPEIAEDAAGKSAAAQALTMALPVGQLMRVPVGLREGLAKTLVNLGVNGVEFGSANAVGTFANNYVAQQTYDPARSLTQGTGDSALEGAIAGLIIPAAVGAARGLTRPPEATVSDVMKAPDLDAAIDAAQKAIDAPTGPILTDVIPTPAFVPPGSQVPAAPRLAAVLAADRQAMASRPAEIPPSSAVDPLTGEAVPVVRPPVDWSAGGPATVQSWGQLFAQRPKEAVADAPDGGVPLSVGAAASREQTPQSQIALSDTDMKANRRVAEMNELLAPPQSNDNNIYVPGSFPTLAERSGDPVISQTEHLLRERNAGAFIGDGKILTENNKARVNAFEAEAVPDTTLASMRRDRAAQWEADSKNILPNAQPVDLTPAAEWAHSLLSDPTIQENDAVRRVLEDFQGRLFDEDGNLKDDPAAAWGMHNNLQNLLAKAKDPLNMTGAEKFAESQILAAKALIDKALNVATGDQFQTALANYAEASKAINSGVLLNNFRPKLTNMAGDLQAANFHRFVVGLAKERGDPGIDPSMDISDKTMRAMINIDADLKRAGLIKLGGAIGSPTNLLGALAENLGVGAASKVAGKIPVVGPLLEAGTDLLKQHQLNNLTKKHLAPPEGGYVYPHSDSP